MSVITTKFHKNRFKRFQDYLLNKKRDAQAQIILTFSKLCEKNCLSLKLEIFITFEV